MDEHTVLVVEDDETVRELLEYRLGTRYNVITAADGEAALELVHEHAPDLIVSDIMMPKMDGFALQAALQDDKNTRVIPFIFLTARADEPARREGTRMGVDDYITKPFDMNQLMARIERLLERMEVFQNQLGAEIGRDFSERLLPKRFPSVDGYSFLVHLEALKQGGGDLLDWTQTPDGAYFVTIGDVMGKGVQAKFYAFSFLSYVRATLHTLLQETVSPAVLLERINQMLLNDEVLSDTFASFLLLRWDPEAHTITYANAGHCPPILASPDGVSLLSDSNVILGLDDDASFDEMTLSLSEKSAFVSYTDGLMEQRLPTGGQLGPEGVRESVAVAYETDDDPVRALLDTVLERSAGDTFEDDTMVLWLQRE